MANKTEYITLAKTRASMYRFLGSMFLTEIDAPALNLLKQMTFPTIDGIEPSVVNMIEGNEILKGYLDKATEDDLEDLAADYAKVFLSAGEATGIAAFPYESVYTDNKRQVGGSSEMQMHALLLEKGYKADPAKFRVFDDHVGLEFEYMAILCDEMAAAFDAEDSKKAKSSWKDQRRFLKKHIMNWVPQFASDILKYADYDFYCGIARITSGFLLQEEEMFEEGVSVWGM